LKVSKTGGSNERVKNSREAKIEIVLKAFVGPFSFAEHSMNFQFWGD